MGTYHGSRQTTTSQVLQPVIPYVPVIRGRRGDHLPVTQRRVPSTPTRTITARVRHFARSGPIAHISSSSGPTSWLAYQSSS